MAQELKAVTVNLKSLDQDIQDPIVAGGADANGRTFRIVFDQEAEAQLTPATKVYLSWFHRQQKIKGYNVFTKVNDDPIIWEIRWPQSMLHEGDVLCCFEIVYLLLKVIILLFMFFLTQMMARLLLYQMILLYLKTQSFV